ncbi:unnamed protein product [Microthlaspi erraticum]|uniref:Uncharacterized protein n=1 Tax=Microthlaspi erraticum TaxID=1685480 RepID=A0A6D2HXJ4_9BRAS|nr:unnamed protein product [Microthlaspi erraticum]CAA7044668.1 unnamed protein product [Microthlaspi erraticum]
MLQKAVSIGHSGAPFSPVRELRHRRTTSTVLNRGFFFSGPITPLLPTASRVKRRTKNDVVCAEPTSPKVSCIGQIKHAKPKCTEKKNRVAAPPKNLKTVSSSLIKEEDKRSFSKLKRLFSTGKNLSRKSSSTAVIEHPIAAPSLGKMKKFASSREALGGFDWTAEMKREESQLDHHRYSTDDREIIIPSSVRIPLTQPEGLSLCPRPKSEVNLWKRRTMDRPKPLQVKAT